MTLLTIQLGLRWAGHDREQQESGSAAGRFFLTPTGRLTIKPTEMANLQLDIDTAIAFPAPPLPDGTANLSMRYLDFNCARSPTPSQCQQANSGGTLSRTAVPLGPSLPRDIVTFEADSMRGVVKFDGRFTCSVCDPNNNLLKNDTSYIIDGDVKFTVNTGGAGGTQTTGAAPQQFTGPVPVEASLIIGNSLVDAQAVQFSVLGGGGLTLANTQTNTLGLASTTFVPPLSNGTAEVTATAVVDGETYEETVDIDFEVPPVAVFKLPFVRPNPAARFASAQINENGQVVALRAVGPRELQIWLPQPAFGLPSGTSIISGLSGIENRRVAYLFNDQGQVLGTDADENPAYWQNGVVTRIPELDSASSSLATGLNASGQITGVRNEEVASPDEFVSAFRGTLAGNIDPLPLVAGVPGHFGLGINSSGTVVARGDSVGGDRETHQTKLFQFPGGISADVAGGIDSALINDRNEIIVNDQNFGEENAFFFSPGSSFQFDGFRADKAVLAYDINNAGTVVGWAPKEFTLESQRGFVYFNGSMQDVNDLIPDEVFDGELRKCLAINDLNQMVCEGQDLELYLISGLPLAP